jgi:Phosphate-starvation-inducible E family
MQYRSTRVPESTAAPFLFVLERNGGGIYTVLACAIALTAIVALAGAGRALCDGLHTWNSSDTILRVIDRLLLVLMLVEIPHTIRISIRSHVLVTEPFLIVGLIATIRRILVITLETANLTRPATWVKNGEAIFRASVTELGLLRLVVLVLVTAIYLLRRSPPAVEEDFGRSL